MYSRAAVPLTPHHTKFYLPWICPTLPSFSTSLPWTPTDTSVSPCLSSPTTTVTTRTHVCWKLHPGARCSPPPSYPFWAASSAPCSWIAVNQMLTAGWLSSNTAKFICLWFFLWDGLSRGQSSSPPLHNRCLPGTGGSSKLGWHWLTWNLHSRSKRRGKQLNKMKFILRESKQESDVFWQHSAMRTSSWVIWCGIKGSVPPTLPDLPWNCLETQAEACALFLLQLLFHPKHSFQSKLTSQANKPTPSPVSEAGYFAGSFQTKHSFVLKLKPLPYLQTSWAMNNWLFPPTHTHTEILETF